jgi:hypothetical protein
MHLVEWVSLAGEAVGRHGSIDMVRVSGSSLVTWTMIVLYLTLFPAFL